MADNGPHEPPSGIVLKITLSPNGQINVNGPIHDKVLCYGLLEFAKDLIRVYQNPTIEVPRIVAPKDLLRSQ